MKILRIGFLCLCLEIFLGRGGAQGETNSNTTELNVTENTNEPPSNETTETHINSLNKLWGELTELEHSIVLKERKIDHITKFRNDFMMKTLPNHVPQVLKSVIKEGKCKNRIREQNYQEKSPELMINFQIQKIFSLKNSKTMNCSFTIS